MEMNCNQCQEASKGIGCTVFGVCGKSPQLSALMDTFIYSLIGLSSLAIEAKKLKLDTEEINDISNKEFKRRYGNRAFSWRGKNIIKRNINITLKRPGD